MFGRCVLGECLDMAGPSLTKLGTQAAVATPDTSPSRQSFTLPLSTAATAAAGFDTIPHFHNYNNGFGGTPGVGSPAAGVAGPFGSYTIQQPNGVQVVVRSEKASRFGDGPVSNFDSVMTDVYVKQSLYSHQAHPCNGYLPGSKSGPGGLPEVMELVHTCHEEQPLVKSQVWLDPGSSSSSSSSTAWLCLSEGLASSSAIESAARQLYSGLKQLFVEVFPAPGAAAAQPPQFFIFYDQDRRLIAFNKSGQLWFNAAASPDLSKAHNPGCAAARFWFLVICHELAHNKVQAHTEFSMPDHHAAVRTPVLGVCCEELWPPRARLMSVLLVALVAVFHNGVGQVPAG
jgi:hypothetical protein